MNRGKVYLVGAGPGAPDLITLRAAELLRRADIVFYDALVHPDTIALAARAEHVAVGKRSGRLSTAQRFINKRLVDAARKHAVVVRLKGGDPMLFGRAQEEIAALQAADIEFEIVPGVTAALAASAEVGVSLTARGRARSVVFLTPRVGVGERPNAWARAAAASDTAVIYMGVGQAAEIAATLLGQGVSPATRIVVAENASLPDARHHTLTLAELPRVALLGVTGPALIMIGEVYAALACGSAPRRDEQRDTDERPAHERAVFAS
ncbi:MAG TPA: uroporphyrinogen-III C-methyltransferase [Burkholderiales bacterium]|nr:uroporphyrinogen-III C-methyltransferase [Burkholderiales bacterium]